MSNKDLEYYLSLPYTRRCEPHSEEGDGGTYWVAWIQEMPALRIDGNIREEALGKLNECLADFLAAMLENSDDIPEPDRWPESVGVPLSERAASPNQNELPEDADIDSQAEESEWSSDRQEPALVGSP